MKILIIGGAGYCGSYLAKQLREEHEVVTLDRKLSDITIDYRIWLEATFKSASYFDIILWFAGASSVKEAEDNTKGALSNNALGLADLLYYCFLTDVYIIYASSASVYSNGPNTCPPFSSELDLIFPRTNSYDRSKFILDYISSGFFDNFLGLRMGTVCGASRPMREETLFNAMNISSIKERKIRLSNPWSYRSILFLPDLLKIVKMAIEDRPKGLLNSASMNIRIGRLAEEIAEYYGSEIHLIDGNPGYSFRMDLTKQNSLIELEPKTIKDRCREFEKEWN